MANEKISELPAGAPAQPTDLIPIARAGSNYNLALGNLSALNPTVDVLISGNTTGVPALISSGTMFLAGGTNVTLSQSGQSISINATGGVAATLGGNTAGVQALISTGTLFLAGGNNVTLSQNANSITISANTAAAATLSVSAGTTSGAFAGLTFSNSNSFSFGLNNGTITASFAQTVQTQASGNIGATGFATTTSAGTAIAGTNNTSGFTLAVPPFITAQTVQTQNLIDVSLSGNTSGALALVSSGTMILAGGNNITLSQNGQSITISGNAGAGGNFSAGVSNLGATAGSTGITGTQLVFAGVNNITLSQSTGANGGTVSLSVANQTNQTVASGNIAGTGVSSATQGGSTLGVTQNTAGLSLLIPQWNTIGVDVTLGGNTSGVQALISTGTLFLAGGNNVTLSQNANSVTISAGGAGGGGATSGGAYVGGNTTGQSSSSTYPISAFNVSAAGLISAGWSSNSLIISAPATTGISQSIYATGNTTQSSSGTASIGSLLVQGTGGVSVGMSNGSLVISGATAGAGGAGAAPGMSTFGNTAGTTGTFSSGTYVLVGAGPVSLSQSTNTAGATLSINAPATSILSGTGNLSILTNGVVISLGANAAAVSIGGNSTSAGAGYSNISSGTLFLAGGNNVTLSQNGASVTVIGGAGGGGGGVGFGVSTAGNTAGATGTVTTGNVVLVGSNAVSLSQATGAAGSAATITINVTIPPQTNQSGGLYGLGNTTLSSSTTYDARSLSFNGLGAMTVGYSAGSGVMLSAPATSSLSATGGLSISVNGSTISIGQGAVSRSIWPNAQLSAVSAPGMGSLSIQYFPCDGALTATRLDGLVGWSAATAATTATMGIALSAWAIVYTNNASTLSSLSSGSTQTTYTYASNSAGNTQLTAGAIRPVSVPVNLGFSQGEYYVGFNFSTAATSVGLSTTNLGQTLSIYGGNQIQSASNYAEFTNATATSVNLFAGMGVYTAATAGAPVSIGLANIAQTGASLSQANIALVFRNY